ncbi:MAG: hypothetical protein ABWZ26_04965 [Candidatus Nanopelagicales bacterium]
MSDTEPRSEDIEVNEADALEQRQDVRDVGLGDDAETAEADAADLAEQQEAVELDEDEYR